jgi:hypothetical protein
MIENEMGYRGSKSVYIACTVKEQRVDGSWFIKKINKLKVYSNGLCKQLSSQQPF